MVYILSQLSRKESHKLFTVPVKKTGGTKTCSLDDSILNNEGISITWKRETDENSKKEAELQNLQLNTTHNNT